MALSRPVKKLSAAQIDCVRRAFDAETEEACDPFSESIGFAKMKAAGNLKRCARRIVDHDRGDGIAIGLGDELVELGEQTAECLVANGKASIVRRYMTNLSAGMTG